MPIPLSAASLPLSCPMQRILRFAQNDSIRYLSFPASKLSRFPAYHHAFSTLHTNAFPSWMLTLGSPTMDVRVLTTSPLATPSQPQCHGIPT